MGSILKRILVFLKIVKKTGRRRKLPANYIQNNNRFWRVFGIVVLCLSLSSYGSTVNWELSQVKDNGALVYGFTGDATFRALLISSIENNTFSTFIASNASKQLGTYTSDSNGYVKSINFTISSSVKTYDIFSVAFDSNNINNYSKAYVLDVQSKTLVKTGVNTFSFNIDTSQLDMAYVVPEPSVASMLLFYTLLMLCRRPKIV